MVLTVGNELLTVHAPPGIVFALLFITLALYDLARLEISAEASLVVVGLRLEIFEFIWHFNKHRVVTLLLNKLPDPAIPRVINILFDICQHLVEFPRLSIVLNLGSGKSLCVALVLLKVVAELRWVNPGLTLEVVALLSDQVGNVHHIFGLHQVAPLLVGFLLFVGLQGLLVLYPIVVAHVLLVFCYSSFFVHADDEVDHGTILFHVAVGYGLHVVEGHRSELVCPVVGVGSRKSLLSLQ